MRSSISRLVHSTRRCLVEINLLAKERVGKKTLVKIIMIVEFSNTSSFFFQKTKQESKQACSILIGQNFYFENRKIENSNFTLWSLSTLLISCLGHWLALYNLQSQNGTHISVEIYMLNWANFLIHTNSELNYVVKKFLSFSQFGKKWQNFFCS